MSDADEDGVAAEHVGPAVAPQLVEEPDRGRERPEHDRDAEEEREEPVDEHHVHEQRHDEDRDALVASRRRGRASGRRAESLPR